MSEPFDPVRGLIIVRAEVEGPSGTALLRLALDTGAASTLINAAMIVALAYDPAASPDRVQVTTASSVEFVSRLPISRLRALGEQRLDFPILCHTLPPSTSVDGLLGLDFFRQRVLTVDFQRGVVQLGG